MPPAFYQCGVLILAAALAAAAQDLPDHVWFGPMPFAEGRELRTDFLPNILYSTEWREVLARTDVFKSYIMLLPDIPPPGKTDPEVSDEEMIQFIALLQTHDIRVAFEVGGARSRDAGAGTAAADAEFVHLSRWIGLGGRIDYLTTDHSIAFGLEDWLETMDPAVSGSMSYDDPEVRQLIQDLCAELANYYVRMATLIPGVRFGAIESLGYWYVEHPPGTPYPGTRPDLPLLPFDEIFPFLVQTVEDRGLTLDHFHSDFGYEGVAFDGRNGGGLDYGRVLGVEALVQSAGVRNGNIVNAFHDRSVPDPDPQAASVEAFDNTLAFFEGYRATGSDPDHMVIQTWQPYPNRTGPEDDPYTVMHMHRTLLTHDAFPAKSGFLRVHIAPQEARDAGARWSVDDGATWHAHDTIARVPRGPLQLTFSDLPEWIAPEAIPVETTGNTTLVVEDEVTTYTPVPPVPLGAWMAGALVVLMGNTGLMWTRQRVCASSV